MTATKASSRPFMVSYYLADLNPHRDKSIGISNYTFDLVRAVSELRQLRIHTLESRSSLHHPCADQRDCWPFRTDTVAKRMLIDAVAWVPLNAAPSEIIHFTKGLLPPTFLSTKKIVVTIHDMILDHYQRTYPEERSALEWRYWTRVLERTLLRADAIITVSEHARAQIEAFAHAHKLPLPSIFVTYEGSRFESYAGTEPLASRRPVFVAFGSPHPHKRTQRLTELWCGRQAARDHTLQLIGNVPKAVTALAAQRDDIECLGSCEENALIGRLRATRGLLVSSEIEGFGLPVLEAAYLGTPSVVVRGTSCHELLDGYDRLTFDLDSQRSFDQALQALLDLPATWSHDAPRRMLERFRWSKVAKATMNVYEQVLLEPARTHPAREPPRARKLDE